MPADKSIFDIEKLKKDPEMWKRLFMTVPDSDKVENVFLGKENPFEEHGEASVARVEALAKEGRLYFREYGRSRHYNKVDPTEDGYQLGEQKDARMAGPYDPVLGNLLRASRWMANKLGWKGLEGWFDKFASRYDNYRQMKKMHKEEYKSLTDNEKENLNKRRDAEKATAQAEQALKELQEKTAAAEKKLAKAYEDRKKLDPLFAQQHPQPSAQDQVKEPEDVEKKQDEPAEKKDEVQAQKDEQQLKQDEQIQQQIQQEQQIKQDEQLPPPEEKQEENKKENQEEKDEAVEEKKPDELNANSISEELRRLPPEVLQKLRQLINQIAQQEGLEMGEMGNLLSNPPGELNKEGSMQIGRPEEQKVLPKTEQLSLEKMKLDAAKNWRETLSDSLFYSDANKNLKEQYTNARNNNPDNGDIMLNGVLFGILGRGEAANGGLEPHTQLFGSILDGQRVGTQFNEKIQDGALAFNAAQEQLQGNNATALQDMMSNTIRQLSAAAASEPALSDRHIMIGRMISETFRMAQDKFHIQLNLSDAELTEAKGALGLSQIVEKGMEARQQLGNMKQIDLKDPTASEAVRNLMVYTGMQQNYIRNITDTDHVNSTLGLIGAGLMDPKKLGEVVSGNKTMQSLTVPQINELISDPNGKSATQIGQTLSDSFVESATQEYEAKQNPQAIVDKDLTHLNQIVAGNPG